MGLTRSLLTLFGVVNRRLDPPEVDNNFITLADAIDTAVHAQSSGNYLFGTATDRTGSDERKALVQLAETNSSGVYLGNSNNPSRKALDWYEESPSDWTLYGNGVALTVTNQMWTRIGNVVTVTADVTWPVTANTNGAQLAGLTYAAKGAAGAAIGYASCATRYRVFVDSSTNIYIYDENGTFMTNAQLSGSVLRFSLTYHCN